MKIRNSTKIAFGFVAVTVGAYFAYQSWSDRHAFERKLEPIGPKKVNLIGIAPGSGYQIIVANQMAALTQAENDQFGMPDDRSGMGEVSGRKRIPIRELIRSLQGDEAAFSELLMKMNDVDQSTLPRPEIVWTAADLRKALDGDSELKAKLESQLNMTLDGVPLPQLSKDALFDGIWIRTPVTMEVTIAQEKRTLTGFIQRPYRPSLLRALEEKTREKFDLTDALLAGYYRELAQPIWDGEAPNESIRQHLESRIDTDHLGDLTAAPQRIIQDSEFVINEEHIESVSYSSYAGGRGATLHDLKLKLTEEGRIRLWQYSRKPGGMGSQLLFVVDGIPIAAPRVTTDLSGREVTIRQLPDEGLVKDAISLIEGAKKPS